MEREAEKNQAELKAKLEGEKSKLQEQATDAEVAKEVAE